MSKIVKNINMTVLASYNTTLDAVSVRVFPEGYGFMANDREIIIDENYPITVTIEDLSEQEIIVKAIETIQTRKDKILEEAMEQAAILEAKITELKLITFVG